MGLTWTLPLQPSAPRGPWIRITGTFGIDGAAGCTCSATAAAMALSTTQPSARASTYRAIIFTADTGDGSASASGFASYSNEPMTPKIHTKLKSQQCHPSYTTSEVLQPISSPT